MKMIAFTTARLDARHLTENDAEALLAVYGDTEAMRWVGDGRALTRGECEQWIEVTRGNYETRGYGMFALEDRATGIVMGFCGLVHPNGQAEPEIKYAFLRSHWNRGYATEAAVGLLHYGGRRHGLSHIIATTAPENVASHRVLLKAGMKHGELRENGDGSITQLFIWNRHQN